MKILVLTESYPNGESQSMAYVHTRNQYYLKQGHEVVVLCFDATLSYTIDQIPVVTEADFKTSNKIQDFSIVISHAPNLRNHIRFLFLNLKRISNIVFFIHGHEVLRKSIYYPEPMFQKSKLCSIFKKQINEVYDTFKLKLLNYLFSNTFNSKAVFIFVSQWMKRQFLKNLGLNEKQVEYMIIPNSVHQVFEKRMFNARAKKLGDFITIRPFDSPKYAVDIVVKAALQNPKFEFHLYGAGEYFSFNQAPSNLKIFNRYFKQIDLPDLLDQYHAAFMPTRLDSQGVMVCEMASYGMDVFTSDIPICREVLVGFPNVYFLSNENFTFNVKNWKDRTVIQLGAQLRNYFAENTIAKELDLFHSILKKS